MMMVMVMMPDVKTKVNIMQLMNAVKCDMKSEFAEQDFPAPMDSILFSVAPGMLGSLSIR